MKIGILSDFFTMTTGYGENTRNLLKHLKLRGHEVVNYALQYTGSPISIGGIEVYAACDPETMARSFNKSKPDMIIHHRDNWVFTPYSSVGTYHIRKQANEAGAKFIAYTPIQATPMPDEIVDSFRDDADFTLTTSQYGLDYIRECGFSNSDYLYHGVEPTDFHPVQIDPDARPYSLPKGTLFMSAGYNLDGRKMNYLPLLVLKEYLKIDPTAHLYMHTLIRGNYMLDVIAKHISLPKSSVIWKPHNSAGGMMWSESHADLNTLYNSASAYITLPSSEGFGKTELEAACLGVPTFVTDFPVHREILSGFSNVRFVASERVIGTTWGLEWLADYRDAVGQLYYEYNHNGFRHLPDPVIPSKFMWENIAARLEKILESI